MSAIKSIPRYAVVPMNDVRRSMERFWMGIEDVQSSPREELTSSVSSIQEIPRGS